MKYENNYIVICLKNHEFMKKEYKIKKVDLLDMKKQLIEEISAPGIAYGEKISSNKISDPTYSLFIKLEEKSKELDAKLDRLEQDNDSLERVIIIFDRLFGVVPSHYYIVDKMVYSDRQTYKNLMCEMALGYF